MSNIGNQVNKSFNDFVDIICSDKVDDISDADFDFIISNIYFFCDYFKEKRKDNSLEYRERQIGKLRSARNRIDGFRELYNEMKNLVEALVKNDRVHPSSLQEVLRTIEDTRSRFKDYQNEEDEDY